MSKRNRTKRKINWKRVIVIVCVVVLAISCLGVISSCFKKDNTKTISASAFSRGGLDENGEYVETKASLYTKEAIPCRGLKIVPEFEAQCTYDVYYYDNYDGLVEKKLGLEKIYDEDYPLHIATTCRIVIHPDGSDAKDYEIGFFDVNKIARKLKITVDKDQTYRYADSVNLFNEEDITVGYSLSDYNGNCNTKTLYEIISESTGTTSEYIKTSNIISVTGEFEKYDIYILIKEPVYHYYNAAISDSAGNPLVKDYLRLYDVPEGTWIMRTIEVPDSESVDHLRLSCPINCEVYVFGYND